MRRAAAQSQSPIVEAVLAEMPTALGRRTVLDPRVAAEWSKALHLPVQKALKDVLEKSPDEMAAAMTPMLPNALMLGVERASRRWWVELGRFLSGLGNFKVWRWMAEALWEGDSITSYVEEKCDSHEVVELLLHNISGEKLLASAQLQGTPARAMAEPNDSDRFCTIVGQRCRLSARVVGQLSAELKRNLQGLCYELDALLETTMQDARERAKLLPLRLQSGLTSKGPFTTRHAGWRVAAVTTTFAAVILALIISVAADEFRWQRFLEIVQREPGIQVTHSERGWGRTSVEGLRRSDSRDPGALAKSLGLDVSGIAMKFETLSGLTATSITGAGPGPTLTFPLRESTAASETKSPSAATR